MNSDIVFSIRIVLLLLILVGNNDKTLCRP